VRSMRRVAKIKAKEAIMNSLCQSSFTIAKRKMAAMGSMLARRVQMAAVTLRLRLAASWQVLVRFTLCKHDCQSLLVCLDISILPVPAPALTTLNNLSSFGVSLSTCLLLISSTFPSPLFVK